MFYRAMSITELIISSLSEMTLFFLYYLYIYYLLLFFFF